MKEREEVLLLRLAAGILYEGDPRLCYALAKRIDEWLERNAPYVEEVSADSPK